MGAPSSVGATCSEYVCDKTLNVDELIFLRAGRPGGLLGLSLALPVGARCLLNNFSKKSMFISQSHRWARYCRKLISDATEHSCSSRMLESTHIVP